MAKFTFRQGIARRQEDGGGNPIFLQKNNTYIDLIVSPDPTVFLAAHGTSDYMFVENSTITNAWGPFGVGADYWLYWDVSFLTGEITRGFATTEPVTSSAAPSTPSVGDHWFDQYNTVMKTWDGAAWVEVIRVFACKYQNGSTIVNYNKGSQVGISNTTVYAGHPLFSPEGKPIQTWQRDRRGKFITTETPLYSQMSRLANFRIEAAINQAEANESIPMHFAIAYNGLEGNVVKLAKNDDPAHPAIGLANEDMIPGEVRSFITKGFVNDDQWNWTQDPGTKLFVGPTGELVTVPPTMDSIQEMGIVVDPQTIFVNPQVVKLFNRGTVQSGNYVPMYTDRITGEEVMWDRSGLVTSGYVHVQSVAASVWTINHGMNTTNVSVQVRNELNEVILPYKVTSTDANTVVIRFDGGDVPYPLVEGTALLTMFFQA